MSDSIDDSVFIAKRLLKVLLMFFDWSAQNYKNVFKVNDANSITDRQFEILFCISKLNCDTISKLERVIPVDSSTLSNAVTKLYRDSFINKLRPDKNGDGRVVHFVLTDSGSSMLNQMENNIRANLKKYVGTLNEEQQHNLVMGLDNIHELLGSFKEFNHDNVTRGQKK